jgi:hypothetical protein
MRKKDIFKKKLNELPLIKNKSKRSTKDSKNKSRGSQKLSFNEKKGDSTIIKSMFSQKNKKINQSSNGMKIKSEKQAGKGLPRKNGNVRQHGRTPQKKGGSSKNGVSSKKTTKNGNSLGIKYGSKTNGMDKVVKNKDDDEKPPQKPTHKLEKGHYMKDHPLAAKEKKDSGRSRVKIKRSSNGLSSRKSKGSQMTKSQNTNKNLTSMNSMSKTEEKNNVEMFEPDRAIKKKVAKKKNFSLNLDTFKNKMNKDYKTHVEKVMSNMQKKSTPKKNLRTFQTEKPKNTTSNFNNKVESEEESDGDFDYSRGDNPDPKSKNQRVNANPEKFGESQGQNKNSMSQQSNKLSMSNRTSSKNQFKLNKQNMSENYRNHLLQKDKKRQDSSSKKLSQYSKGSGIRNSSFKDFTRRKKQNLSISMNKRGGMNTINLRKKSNDPLNTRKKNQSINPGTRFMNAMEKAQRKRAVSETHSVSNISFTNLEKAGIRKTKNIVDYIKQREHTLPPFTRARSVVKDFGIIKAFIVNTHKGTVRAGNEDRVSILLNAQHKFRKSKKKMNNCAMFSVFDGHGGTDCCNFLKENLHNKILADLNIHEDFDDSMKRIFKEIDSTYLKRAIKKKQNYSGSCANCLFVLDEEVVVVNTGDSRTICSKNKGQEIEMMSIDHKPGAFGEFSRVINNGGQLYRVSSNLKTIENMFYTVTNYSDVLQIDEIENTNKNLCFGPWRIKPGGLSVSR